MAREQRRAAKGRAQGARVVSVCAWCRVPLPGVAQTTAPSSGAISHGVCAPCARRLAGRASRTH